MVWNGNTIMELRSEFVRLASQPGANKSRLCRQFGITRKTAYKWLSRIATGDETFQDHSRRPKYHPNQTPEEIEKLVIKARNKFPTWGGRKLYAWLIKKGYNEVPVPSTITKILARNNLLNEEISEQNKPWVRFEHERPNKLWQIDFKGHFAMRTGRCHPLTLLDDHSRFSISLEACPNERRETVEGKLISVFKRYGLPERINADNGNPWGNSAEGAITKLAVWLIRLGIEVSYSRPNHPQTNGKIERFHRSLKAELLNDQQFYDISSTQKAFNRWRQIYNEERPHESLDMKVPIDRYQPSSKAYPNKLPDIEYGLSDIIRKVSKKGTIRLDKKSVYVSEGLAGLPIGLRPTTIENRYDIYLCNHKLKEIDLLEYE